MRVDHPFRMIQLLHQIGGSAASSITQYHGLAQTTQFFNLQPFSTQTLTSSEKSKRKWTADNLKMMLNRMDPKLNVEPVSSYADLIKDGRDALDLFVQQGLKSTEELTNLLNEIVSAWWISTGKSHHRSKNVLSEADAILARLDRFIPYLTADTYDAILDAVYHCGAYNIETALFAERVVERMHQESEINPAVKPNVKIYNSLGGSQDESCGKN